MVLALNLPGFRPGDHNPKVVEEVKPERDERILSPSQVEAFECERKGAFKYLAKLEDPGNQDTDIGKRFHKLLEDWLKHGISPDEDTLEGKMAHKALAYLPMPKAPGVKVEGEFTFTDHGIQYTGTKDLEYWVDYVQRKGLIVHDHKSCGSFQYVKTPDVLRTDTQAVLYAQHAFQKYPELNELELNWGYTTKQKEPAHRKVHLTVYRDAVDVEAEKVAVKGRRILDLKANHPRTVEGINQLPPNLGICSKFRGCPYGKSGACKLTPSERIRAGLKFHDNATKPRKVSTMNFSDLKNKLSKGNLTTIAAPAVPAAALVTPAPATTAQAAPVQAAPVQSMREKLGVPPAGPAVGVNPPPLALQASANPPPPAPTPTQVQEATASVAHSLAGEAPRVEEQPKKRGGRKPGSKNKPKNPEAAEAAAADEFETTDYPNADDTPADEEYCNAGPGPLTSADADDRYGNAFVLCINGYPTKSANQVIELGALLAPVVEALQVEHDVKHYKLVEYGKGPGVLAYGLECYLKQNPLDESTVVVLDMRTPEGADCVNVLTRFAGAVYRGF